MPVYEYVCTSCKNKFELMRPFSKSGEGAECPCCHKKANRVLSTCYSKTVDAHGAVQPTGGSSCSSCSSGNCSSCGH